MSCLRVEGIGFAVIQAPKPEPRSARHRYAGRDFGCGESGASKTRQSPGGRGRPVAEVTGDLGVRRISVGASLVRMAWAGFMQASKERAEQGMLIEFANDDPGGELNKTGLPYCGAGVGIALSRQVIGLTGQGAREGPSRGSNALARFCGLCRRDCGPLFLMASPARTGAATHTRQSTNIYSSAYHLASARIGRGIG